MKKILALFLTAVFCMSVCRPVCAEETLALYAKAAVLMDADTGRVLYGKEAQTVLPMASTTKIMTLILALEYGNGDDYVTVSSYAAKMPDVSCGIRAGEQYRLTDLLYSMMLESHNDSACAVAEHVGGSVEGFADMMNRKAKEIGLDHTYFITPNGLDAEDENGVHSTTAEDLALLMRYCVFVSDEREMFTSICQTRNYTFSDITGQRSFSVTNKNALLDRMDGVLAGKTGFTGNAGYCYVAAVTVGGKNFIVSLLACGWPSHKTYKWADTQTLLSYGSENYEYQTFSVPEYQEFFVPVINGTKEVVRGSCSGEVTMLLRKDETFYVRAAAFKDVSAPVKKGDPIGEIYVSVDGMTAKTFPVLACEDMGQKDFSYYAGLVFDSFFY